MTTAPEVLPPLPFAVDGAIAILHRDEILKFAREYHALNCRAGVPDGWQLVPKVPTQPMRDAGNKKLDYLKSEPGMGVADRSFYAWEAMLAASLQPPVAQPDPGAVTDEMVKNGANGLTGLCNIADPEYISRLVLEAALSARSVRDADGRTCCDLAYKSGYDTGKMHAGSAQGGSHKWGWNDHNKPTWDNAPEWAEYLAMDRDGTWHWWASRPALEGGEWKCFCQFEEAGKTNSMPTLLYPIQRRPTPASPTAAEVRNG